MPFVAICPACLHDTSVDVARLRSDGGRVACSRCTTLFSGLESLRYLDRPAPAAPEAESQAASMPSVSAPAPALTSVPPPSLASTQASTQAPVQTPDQTPVQTPAPPPAMAAVPELSYASKRVLTPAATRSPSAKPSDTATLEAEPAAAGFRFGSPFDDDPPPLPPPETPARSRPIKPAAPPLRAWPEEIPYRSPASAVGALVFLSLLTLGLVLQLGMWLRQPLFAALPVLRPALQWVGEAVDRPVTPMRQLQAISIESFEIRQPVTGRLSAAGLLRNRSDYALVWPAIELSLTDQTGALIVRKVIEPHEYVRGDGQLSGFAAQSEFPLELNFASAELSPASFAVSLFYP